ncbi:hypothetical protein CKO08_12760, partial [Halorhodospira halochloris]|nr:hypothetical protein [Halorhodospira halochloris]
MEGPASGIKNTAVQAPLMLTAFGGHVPNAQRLQAQSAELFDQSGRDLMEKVVALIGHLTVQPAQLIVRLAQPVGDGEAPTPTRRLLGRLLLAGDLALYATDGIQGAGKVAGVIDGLGTLRGRHSGEGLQAPVEP